MRKIKTLFALGVIILLVPRTGFSGTMKSFFLEVTGVLVCLISFWMYRIASRTEKIKEEFPNIKENEKSRISVDGIAKAKNEFTQKI